MEQVIKEKFGLFQGSLFKEVVGEVGVKKRKRKEWPKLDTTMNPSLCC